MSTSSLIEEFPLPTEGIDDGEFWDACNDRTFVIQQCADCGTLRHPPKPVCAECQSFDTDWKELPGTGEVYTYTITHYSVSPDYEEHVPYNVSVVLLDETEDIRFVTSLRNVDVDDIEIGMPVELTWVDVDEETTLPFFQPRS